VVRPDCHEYPGRVENCLRRVPERYFYQIQAKSKPGKEIGAPELNKHNSKENRYSVKVCKEGPYLVTGGVPLEEQIICRTPECNALGGDKA